MIAQLERKVSAIFKASFRIPKKTANVSRALRCVVRKTDSHKRLQAQKNVSEDESEVDDMWMQFVSWILHFFRLYLFLLLCSCVSYI